MTRRLVLLAVAGALLVPAATAQSPAKPMVFKGASGEAEVWVSVELARHRLDEAFLPLLVTVSNRAKGSVTLTRESFRLLDHQGREIPLAELGEVRKEYGKLELDHRQVSGVGLPLGTKLDQRKYIDASYFPVVTFRGGVKRDTVSIGALYWTVDLFYFRWPEGLRSGTGATLRIEGKGWEEPVTIPFAL